MNWCPVAFAVHVAHFLIVNKSVNMPSIVHRLHPSRAHSASVFIKILLFSPTDVCNLCSTPRRAHPPDNKALLITGPMCCCTVKGSTLGCEVEHRLERDTVPLLWPEKKKVTDGPTTSSVALILWRAWGCWWKNEVGTYHSIITVDQRVQI